MSVRVLMVEDNTGDARLIEELLAEAQTASFDVLAVSRLAEAKAVLAGERADVILLDLGLPDCQGLETLTRALDFAEEIPIVVLTGNRAEMFGTEATRMGAQDYLVKGETSADGVERSLLYAIERKKAQDDIRNALQTCADLVREIPSGLLTFKYEPPGGLSLLSWNPRAGELLDRDRRLVVGRDLGDIWPFTSEHKKAFLEVVRSGSVLTHKGGRFQRDGEDVALDLRAFRIPDHRLCISIDDVTERFLEEELRKRAYSQIETNIEHFASLVDEIRNPNSVIIGVAERLDGNASKCILLQAERIESIIHRLDEQWVASENLRQFLRRSIKTPPF